MPIFVYSSSPTCLKVWLRGLKAIYLSLFIGQSDPRILRLATNDILPNMEVCGKVTCFILDAIRRILKINAC